jgi:uncharacterized protein
MPLDFPPFRPHPLVRGGHMQTIVGSYLPSRVTLQSTLHQVPLADGDAIALHEDRAEDVPTCQEERGRQECPPQIAILLHGLAGCHQSAYMLRCSAKLLAGGARVFRMDLRGCGAGIGLARQPLHAGRSEDAAAALDYVSRQFPGSPIHLVGFSMGANIVLKLAGELGEAAPACLASVTAVSPPIDLYACTRHIQRGFSRVYDRRFVRALIQHVGQRQSLLPEALFRPLVPTPTRLIDFDSLFTAPLAGFADVYDYYTRASSSPLLARIAVPTLIITAASDPIVPVASFERASYSSTTQLHIAPCGGHLGFVGIPRLDPDVRWIDWRIVEWITSQPPRRQNHQLPMMPMSGP